MLWTREQRAFAVESFFSNGRSLVATQRAFRARFEIPPHRLVPGRNSILSWVNSFRECGSVAKPRNGLQRMPTSTRCINMPARKKEKPAATEVADAQAKDETALPSKKRAVSEEKEELDEVEKESEAVSEDEASKPKRGRGRPKKAVNDAPKVVKGSRGRPAKQKQENKEDKDENNDKTTKPRKGRGR